MRLMISLLMSGFLVACGDKDAEDTAVEDSALEELQEGEQQEESEVEGEE